MTYGKEGIEYYETRKKIKPGYGVQKVGCFFFFNHNI